MAYINIKSKFGVETIDEINESDFKTFKEYLAEKINVMKEYRMIYENVYFSQRCTKDWKNKA